MKKHVKKMMLVSILFSSLIACNSKTESTPEATTESTTENTPESQIIKEDKEVLSNDSATVQTAVGVKDEEQNAKSMEAEAAKELEKDMKNSE